MGAAIEVDVVVLGTGPGGEYVANKLGRAGLDVVTVDEDLVGGECPFYGCTPSKLLIRDAVRFPEDFARATGRVRTATNDWHDHTYADRLEESGVRIVRGHGRLDGPGRVRVTHTDGTTTDLVGRRGVVLGTGTRPSTLPIDGLDATPYWTNRTVFRVTDLPARLVVVGGGAIGCELAQTFSRFGSEVTLLESADRVMSPEEPETSDVITRVFRREGIDVRAGVDVEHVAHDGRYVVRLAGGEEVESDALLVAAGRTPNLDDVGLETVGLDPDARSVATDERMRAGERLWAVGDITGRGAFTHVARYQGVAVVRDVLGEDGPWAEYHAVTRVTFTDPEVGAVGLTEAQARDEGLDVRVGTASIARSSRGWIHGEDTDGVVKVVADAERGILVGATTVAPYGGEVLGLLAAAVHARTPVETVRGMHFAYLTFHRTIQNALGQL